MIAHSTIKGKQQLGCIINQKHKENKMHNLSMSSTGYLGTRTEYCQPSGTRNNIRIHPELLVCHKNVDNICWFLHSYLAVCKRQCRCAWSKFLEAQSTKWWIVWIPRVSAAESPSMLACQMIPVVVEIAETADLHARPGSGTGGMGWIAAEHCHA